MARCRTAPLRQVSQISSCRCGRSPRGCRNSSAKEALRRPNRSGKKTNRRCGGFFRTCAPAPDMISPNTRDRRFSGALPDGCRYGAWRSLAGYLTALRENVEEAQALFGDLLISVTTFFRDPASFEKLADLVVAKLFEEGDAAAPIRVWVPGCATGEEAYSIAMLFLEEAGRHDMRPELQVFASDLDGAALVAAREGRYPLAIEADVSEERLRRFFTRETDHYVVKRELREIVLFATHSLLKDPPFSQLDLISCRNLLIYLDRESQQQVGATLHYGLRPGGYLFLGSSESADHPPGLFRTIDRQARIYQSTAATADSVQVICSRAAKRGAAGGGSTDCSTQGA